MTHQNRVLPSGEIVAHPARGTFMGNRGGTLHDSDRRLGVRRWAGPAWIVCRLEFKGRRRALMAPGRYTELFFLDEAVALAAGHRPCAECRRADYRAFKAAFGAATGSAARAVDMDRRLHRARVTRARAQVTFEAQAARLPDGTFVSLDGAAQLVRGDTVLRFTPEGYVDPRPRPEGVVTVLTPAPTVATLARGYTPRIHESAR